MWIGVFSFPIISARLRKNKAKTKKRTFPLTGGPLYAIVMGENDRSETYWERGRRDLENKVQNRPGWFRYVKGFLRLFVRRPHFEFLGKTFESSDEPFILLSNHVGASAPVRYELYLGLPFRFWGTYEMTMGLRSVYRYLSRIYLYRKKHYPKYLARVIGFIISPFVNLFYKGIRLIPTYTDLRLRKTFEESRETMEKGQNLVIFPEDSSDGYHDTLTSFYAGFALLGCFLAKKGRDVPVYFAYYRKKTRTFVVGAPIRFSEFGGDEPDIREIARNMCDRVNALSGQ